jgi:uncharacterized protein (DUF2252 family)
MTEFLTTATERQLASGKRRRTELPRKALADLAPRPEGFDPIALLEAQSSDRIEYLVPLRYGRMASSEFAFLRGAAGIMAYDLALNPRTDIDAQLCGDAHVSNFGVFYSPERRLVFDVNDFDETLPGPFEWDVKRLIASAAVGFAGIGFEERELRTILTTGGAVYRQTLKELASRGTLEVWYSLLDVESYVKAFPTAFHDENHRPIGGVIDKAKRSDSRSAFKKMIVFEGGTMGFRNDPPLLVPLEELPEAQNRKEEARAILEPVFSSYGESLPDDRRHLFNEYELVDVARKVVGVGSVGTRCFVALLLGRGFDDPLILQIKEATNSVLEDHLGPSRYETSGARVVEGQRLMQTTPDIFLGSTRVHYSESEYHDFYVRQFHDGKASVELSQLTTGEMATRYLSACAWTLARAHARSGDREAIASYLGGSDAFDSAIADWGLAYGERNRSDYQAFVAAIESGRIQVAEDKRES